MTSFLDQNGLGHVLLSLQASGLGGGITPFIGEILVRNEEAGTMLVQLYNVRGELTPTIVNMPMFFSQSPEINTLTGVEPETITAMFTRIFGGAA